MRSHWRNGCPSHNGPEGCGSGQVFACRRAPSTITPPAYTTPDWLARARQLAADTGLPERRILEIMAGKIATALAAATAEQHRFHLSRDLDGIEARIREIDGAGQ